MNPNNIHDPLRDVLPHAGRVFAFDARSVLVACLAVLLIALLVRMRRTPVGHPDYAARADMTRLLAIVWGGLLVEWTRSRFDLATPGFWLASVALLPFVVGALLLSARLFRVYRQSQRREDKSRQKDTRQEDKREGGRR